VNKFPNRQAEKDDFFNGINDLDAQAKGNTQSKSSDMRAT
jgi:hypothetical protein